MRCWKCFRVINAAYLTTDYLYTCDLCYYTHKRVLAKIKANRERRKNMRENRRALLQLTGARSGDDRP